MTRYLGYWDKETQKFVEVRPKKKEWKAPSIQTDEMPPVETMADASGQVFTSRSRYKRHLKEHGMEITGGDHLTHQPPEPHKSNFAEIREDALRAANQIKYGDFPFTEQEKEICLRELRAEQAWKRRNFR